jgi:DhnA family fructose-bisphosphate aldolase class Ia
LGAHFTGIDRRMANLFAADGKSLILAFDHGIGGANYSGMANPEKTLTDAVAAGADAILTTVGQALRFGQIISRVGLVINLDDLVDDPTYGVTQALSVGADMGKVIAFPGSPTHVDSVHRAARLCAIAHQYSLPMMVEPIPVSFESKADHTPDKIGPAARMAAEMGGDLLKIQYTGEASTFREVMAPLFRPVIVLGGPNRGNIREVFTDVRTAIDEGAVGIAIGRNIWAHETPAKVVAAMGAIIHGGASVDEAMKELN